MLWDSLRLDLFLVIGILVMLVIELMCWYCVLMVSRVLGFRLNLVIL